MINIVRRISFLILILNWQMVSIFGQDTLASTSEANLVKFAKYLMVNKEYHFASDEYYRLTYLYPENQSYFSGWLNASRHSNRLEQIQQRLKVTQNTPPRWQLEYTLACIKARNLGLARIVLDEGKLTKIPEISTTATKVDFGLKLLDIHPNRIDYTVDDAYLTSLKSTYDDQKYKSPFLAGVLSGIIPGTGRVYAKDYINGLMSLLFVASTSYQAIARFNKRGSKSVGGWIYAGIGTGFYLGNIYGSVRSAKQHNRKLKSKLDEQTINYITGLEF